MKIHFRVKLKFNPIVNNIFTNKFSVYRGSADIWWSRVKLQKQKYSRVAVLLFTLYNRPEYLVLVLNFSWNVPKIFCSSFRSHLVQVLEYHSQAKFACLRAPGFSLPELCPFRIKSGLSDHSSQTLYVY